jgi:hypothetical protein
VLAGWVACYLGKHGQTEVVGNLDITIGTQCHIIYNKALGIVKGGVEGHGTYCGLPSATSQFEGYISFYIAAVGAMVAAGKTIVTRNVGVPL